MTVEIVQYPDIEHTYQLTQPLWLKAIVFTGASTMLILAFYLFATNLTILIGLVVVIVVIGFGIYNQLKDACMCPLLANKEALYIIASPNGKEFLRLPWPYFQNVESGMHGLNKRGLTIRIDASLLVQDGLDLITSSLNIVDSSSSQIVISVPTGVANRAREGLSITDFKKVT